MPVFDINGVLPAELKLREGYVLKVIKTAGGLFFVIGSGSHYNERRGFILTLDLCTADQAKQMGYRIPEADPIDAPVAIDGFPVEFRRVL